MSMEELVSRYTEMCDGQDDCDFCEYNQGDCRMKFSYEQGRVDALDELVALANKKLTVEEEDGYIRPMRLEEMVELLKEQKNG